MLLFKTDRNDKACYLEKGHMFGLKSLSVAKVPV